MRKSIWLLWLAASVIFSSCEKKGCTDPEALNFYEAATKDDGSCVYLDRNTNPLPIYLSGTYAQAIVLKNLGGSTEPNGEQSYDYIIQGGTTFKGGLTVEPGVRMQIHDMNLGDNATHSFVGTEDEPIIIDGNLNSSSGYTEIHLNGSCEFRHVHMRKAYPHVLHLQELIFSNNIVIEADYGFDFTYQSYDWISGSLLNYYNPLPFVKEFENNQFSDIYENNALNIPPSMLSGIGTSNEFNLAPNQYIQLGVSGYVTSQNILPHLEGNHTWKNLNVPLHLHRLQLGKTGINGQLTIESGTLMLMGNGFSSTYGTITTQSGSSLIVNGTSSSPVRIIKGSDSWGGIEFLANSTGNVIKHAEISGAGRYPVQANIKLGENSSLTISDTEIKNSAGCGVKAPPSATYTESGNMVYSGNVNGNICN